MLSTSQLIASMPNSRFRLAVLAAQLHSIPPIYSRRGLGLRGVSPIGIVPARYFGDAQIVVRAHIMR